MDIDTMIDFCMDHINELTLKQREETMEIVKKDIALSLIDSSNSDGSRIYFEYIPEETIKILYNKIKSYLE